MTMTDERRWITRLREWIDASADTSWESGHSTDVAWSGGYRQALADLAALLDDVECASNPNNEGTNS